MQFMMKILKSGLALGAACAMSVAPAVAMDEAPDCRTHTSFSGVESGDQFITDFSVRVDDACAEGECGKAIISRSVIYTPLELEMEGRSIMLGLSLEMLLEASAYEEFESYNLAPISLDMGEVGAGLREYNAIRQRLGGERSLSVRFTKADTEGKTVATSNKEAFKLMKFELPTSIFSYADLNRFVFEDPEAAGDTPLLGVADDDGLKTFIRFENAQGEYVDMGPIDQDISTLTHLHMEHHDAARQAFLDGACR